MRFQTYVKGATSLVGTDFDNITVNFNQYDTKDGDNLTFDFDIVTYTNNEWPFDIQNANDFDIVFNMSADTNYKEWPDEIELDIGDDAELDWKHFDVVKGNEMTSTLNHKFNDALALATPIEDQYGNEVATIPLRINSTGNGTLQLVKIDIEYDFTGIITGFGDDIKDYVIAHQDEGDVITVPLRVHSSSKGKVKLERLNYTYDGAPVNWPLIPLNLELEEDTADFHFLDLDKYFIDDYDDDLDYEVVGWSPSDKVIMDIEDGRWLKIDLVNATNGTDWYGTVNVQGIRAIDDQGFEVETGSFIFVVQGVNDPPALTTSPVTKAEVGLGYIYDANATDVEKDTLSFYLDQKPVGMVIDKDVGLVSWTPRYIDLVTNLGFHNVTINVSDGADSTLQDYQIEVTSENNAPVFNSTPSTEAWVGQVYRYEIIAYDADPYDRLVYTLGLTHPWGMMLEGTVITWTPGQTQSGDHSVVIFVFDGLANMSQQWVITVGMNFPPEYTTSPPLTAKVDEQYVYQVSATDDDLDPITYSLKDGPDDMTMSTDGRVTWTPKEGDQNFTWLVVIEITDGKAVIKQEFNISVDPKDGPPPPPPPNGNGGWELGDMLPYLLLLIIIIVVVALVVAMGRRGKKGSEQEEDEWPEMDEGGTGAVIKAKGPPSDEEGTTIDDVFVIYKDGRLITHQARRLAPDMDSDIISGMFTAIQSFIKDSFAKGEEGVLNSFEYGEKKILLSHGEKVFLAMVINGPESKGIRGRMASTLEKIEYKYGDQLADWNGRLDDLKGIDKTLKPLVAMTRSEKQRALDAEMVNFLGDVDFHKGFVVVKTALMNGSESVITDAEVKLVYNSESLRLDHLEPDLKFTGSEVKLSNLGPGERKTVAFYLDPLICVKSNIDATVTFKDSKGSLRTKNMEQLKAEVVCPVLFSDEDVNVAMLKRQIGELPVHDSKVFPIPDALTPKRAMELGRQMLSNYKARLVREFVEEEPYSAEVWFHGRSKFSKKPVVIRLSVNEDTKTVEFFVATEELPALTGLLAELGHEYAKVLRTEGISGKVSHITDPLVRDRIIRKSKLLIHRYAGSEEAEAEIKPADTEK